LICPAWPQGCPGTVGLEAYASAADEIALERFSSVFGAGAKSSHSAASRLS